MLHAKKPNIWARSYEITADGRPISTFSPSWWRSGGRLFLDGVEYTIRGNVWGRTYAMTTGDDRLVAAASRVGRRHWSVQADGREFRFERESFFGKGQVLMSGDQRVGLVSRAGVWRNSGANADLPGMSLPAQVFVVAVVLTLWEKQAHAGAAAAGAASG